MKDSGGAEELERSEGERRAFEALAAALRVSRHTVVLTGAGVSAESGLPTFRDAMTGLWARYDPMELASPRAFLRDPALVTEWYDHRRVGCLAARPNAGHVALARLGTAARRRGARWTLLTQNVDRLHQRAGEEWAVELHGNIVVWRCVGCGAGREELGPAMERYPPRCGCGGLRRPDVVWFGEMLPVEALRLADEAVEACDLFLAVGAGALVYPVAGYIDRAIGRGIATVEINPNPTPMSDAVRWRFARASAGVLESLAQCVVS